MNWNNAGVLLLLMGSLLSDIKNKRIPLWWLALHMAVATGLMCAEAWDVLEAVCSAVPGITLLIIAAAARGRIGVGDALLTLILGLYLGLWACIFVLLVSLLLSAVFGVCRKAVRHVSLKKPVIFTPFLCLGFGIWWACSLM